MKVVFDGESAVFHQATGLELVPGTNEVPDDKGRELLALKVCRKPGGKPESKPGPEPAPKE